MAEEENKRTTWNRLENRNPLQSSNRDILRVSTRSRPSAVAGAIAGVIREHLIVEIQSIGAGATNQAVKAIAIASSYLREEGIAVSFTPAFIDISIDDEERTAIRFVVERLPGDPTISAPPPRRRPGSKGK